MDRRTLLACMLAMPMPGRATALQLLPLANLQRPAGRWQRAAAAQLTPSDPVISQTDGQIIENLAIESASSTAITVFHQNVIVRNCRIRHGNGHGISAVDAAGLILQDLQIDRIDTSDQGPRPSRACNNIDLENCAGAIIERVKASRGSANIYVLKCPGSTLRFLELHSASGPLPRGQNVQLDKSPDTIIEDFSAENNSASWTEDNISVFRSDRCIVRRGLVSYNNSPSGDGVMLEGSFDCLVEDVDAEQQGNGAFAAVPIGDKFGSGGCTFRRCRTRRSYNTPRDGRGAPSSRGLSIYTRISAGAEKHSIIDCNYFALSNPRNLVWDPRAVNDGWSFTRRAFTARLPMRLTFDW